MGNLNSLIVIIKKQLNEDEGEKMNSRQIKKITKPILLILFLSFLLSGCISSPDFSVPGVKIEVGSGEEQEEVSTGVKLLVLMTVLSVAPAILILATAFTRIVIVLSMLRSAIGTPSIPPNQVIVGLALLLTFFVMTPIFNEIDQMAIQPFMEGQIDQTVAIETAVGPVREFMFQQVSEQEIALFMNMRGLGAPGSLIDVPTSVLLPAFVVSELKIAFMMGFMVYVPFLIIDMVVSSLLLAMGMMMLPPSTVSLPFKLLLFVMADGWYLISQSLAVSFY